MTREQFGALGNAISAMIAQAMTGADPEKAIAEARALFVTDKFILTCIAGPKHFVLSSIDDSGKFGWTETKSVLSENDFAFGVQVSKVEAAMFIGILTAAEPRDHFGMVKVP